MFNWIKALLLSLPRAEQTQREREREVCARWTEQTQREREREREREERERERGVCTLNRADAEREREREVCARAGRARPCARATVRRFSETRFGRFFEGKKVAKGVCNVAKLVINALTLTALIYIYKKILATYTALSYLRLVTALTYYCSFAGFWLLLLSLFVNRFG